MPAAQNELTSRHCQPLPPGAPALKPDKVNELLRQVPGWALNAGQITRTFSFKNYHETMAFVNAVAWIAHGEDHHPDLEVGYNKCVVKFNTHSVGGLSENDFISAAKVNALGAE